MSNQPITLAFVKIAALAKADGIVSTNNLPGCWERQIGDWWIAVNGHDKPVKCSHGGTVPIFNAYLEFNGWPAGVIDPFGGLIAAGDGANEDSFIAAIDAALKEKAT